jgi:hypothetical protein
MVLEHIFIKLLNMHIISLLLFLRTIGNKQSSKLFAFNVNFSDAQQEICKAANN